MPGGTATSLDELPGPVSALLTTARRAVMTTVGGGGAPHSVPVVFARVGAEIVSPIDHKPKSGVVMKRVRNLKRDQRITLLIDHWDEDWTQLVWLMVRGRGILEEEPDPELMRAINERYEQYKHGEVHDALIRIRPKKLSWWAWTGDSPS